LFLFHLGFLASIFSIGARAGSFVAAAVVTLLCVAWGLPNYFAGLPSWYNLGLAIFGTHAAIKYSETNRLGWIFLAGVLGGLSCLFKVAGIYLLLALFVFVLQWNRLATGAAGASSDTPRPVWVVLVALAVPIVFLLAVTWSRLGVMEVLYFILPATVVCAFVGWHEVTGSPRPSLGETVRSVLCLAAGAALPVALFLVPYVLRQDIYSVYRGLFVLPQLRFDFAFHPVPPAFTLLAAVPAAAVVCVPLFFRIRAAVWVPVVLAVCLAVLLPFGSEAPIYRVVWYSVRPLGPIAAVLLCILLVRRRMDPSIDAERKRLMFLMAAVAAFHSVIQFPYAFGVYFYYAAPPILLALLFLSSLASTSWARVQLCLALFYIAFGMLWLNTANVRSTGVRYTRSEAKDVLLPERANLRVSEADKAVYEALVSVINELAGDDPYIMATPDCPEVYFLSRRKNPTRVFYEFFDPAKPTPEQLLATLASKGVKVVVLNGSPEFSAGVSQELYGRLAEAYPEHVDIGWFRVLWKT
jgi:hypothetical protein